MCLEAHAASPGLSELEAARLSHQQVCCSVIVAGCVPVGCVSTQNVGHHDGSVLVPVLITFKVCMLLLAFARRSDMDPCSCWWPQQRASRPATGPSTIFPPRRGRLPASPCAPTIPRRTSSRGEGCIGSAQVDSEVVQLSTFCSVAHCRFPFWVCVNALAVLRLWVALFVGTLRLVSH